MRAAATLRTHWPAWLAALALALHLLAPGLCLAQSLSSAPLGALCTAGDATASLPSPAGSAEAHGASLDHCELCVAGAALIADTSPRAAVPVASADAAPRRTDAPRDSDGRHWRPPPRAPPRRA